MGKHVYETEASQTPSVALPAARFVGQRVRLTRKDGTRAEYVILDETKRGLLMKDGFRPTLSWVSYEEIETLENL